MTETPRQGEPRSSPLGSRTLLGVLLILLMGFSGFWLGALIGAAFLVPVGSGLAGGAIVFMYGLLGAGMSVVAAFVLAWRLRLSTLRTLLVVFGIVALAAMAWLTYRVMVQNRPAVGSGVAANRVAGFSTLARRRIACGPLAPPLALASNQNVHPFV